MGEGSKIEGIRTNGGDMLRVTPRLRSIERILR